MKFANKKKPVVLDLFCGCGGLSFGLKRAGFEILLGVDLWEDALKTFAYNDPGAKTLKADISKLRARQIMEIIGNKRIGLIVGGPPCQGFSLSGPRNFYDPRNRLYTEFLRIVKEFQPQGFLIENVPGLSSLFRGKVKERIIQEFSKLGYAVVARVLNASDYGVPQNRKRIFFVGLKGKDAFALPEPTHFDSVKGVQPLLGRKKVTVWEAIGDLPLLENEPGVEEMPYTKEPFSEYQRLMRRGSEKIYNHVAAAHAEKTIKMISLVREGRNYKMLPDHLKKTRNFHVAWTRLHRRKPSPTIDTGHRHHFHPIANRIPTVREAARLQSFPDIFKFLGNKTSQYKQVGNAVSPLLAFELGKKLIQCF